MLLFLLNPYSAFSACQISARHCWQSLWSCSWCACSGCTNIIWILHVRDQLPAQNQDEFLKLETWLSDGNDEIMTLNQNHVWNDWNLIRSCFLSCHQCKIMQLLTAKFPYYEKDMGVLFNNYHSTLKSPERTSQTYS